MTTETEQQLTLPIIADGTAPTVNARTDAITVYADAIQGAMVSPFNFKLTFVEHFLLEGEPQIQAKNILNLVMPTQQLRPIGDLLHRLAAEFEQQVATANGNGE